MKHLTALLILLLFCSWSHTITAQTTDSWVSVPLEDERLTVRMPKSHEVKSGEFSFERFNVAGRVYTAKEDGVDYSVWALVEKREVMALPPSSYYLDQCADLVWDSLLKPRRDQLPEKARHESRMSYAGELTLTSLQTDKVGQLALGREYSIMLGNRPGTTQFYVAGRQIYVLVVLNEDVNRAAAQRFVNSFRPNREAHPQLQFGRGGGIAPGQGENIGGGIGVGRGENVGGGDRSATSTAGAGTDYNRVFKGNEVTQKARVTSKPEPTYTESARKYAVQGTVALVSVFSRSGEVTSIRIVSGLPHGLTEKAIGAARQIKFTPAQKDGHEVSMFIRLEYNFNLY